MPRRMQFPGVALLVLVVASCEMPTATHVRSLAPGAIALSRGASVSRTVQPTKVAAFILQLRDLPPIPFEDVLAVVDPTGDPSEKTPGTAYYADLRLRRGVVRQKQKELFEWIEETRKSAAADGRDGELVLVDDDGSQIGLWVLKNAMPVKLVLPPPEDGSGDDSDDAGSTTVLIESLTLEVERVEFYN